MVTATESVSERIERLAYEKEVLRMALRELRDLALRELPESSMYQIAATALSRVSD